MENKIYLYLRYLILGSMLLGISISTSNTFETLLIILILIFIINSQLRYFTFRGNDYILFISLLVEWTIGYILYSNYGGILIVYFIIGISDVFFLINKDIIRYISIVLGFSISFYAGKFLSLVDFFSYGISILSISIVSSIVQFQYGKNKKIEELYDKLRKSEHRLIETNKELKDYSKSLKELTLLKERNRISREIHDSVGHSLSTIIIQLGAIEKIAPQNGEKASSMISNLIDFSKNGLGEIRNVLKELKPKDLSEYELIFGIENLINDFIELTNIDVKITYSKNKYGIKEDVSLVLYRAVQEFLSNSIKHGNATKISIFLNFEENELIVTMKDNGTGTDKFRMGMGLTSLRERVKEVNGSVHFESQIEKGFSTRISFKGGRSDEN